MAWILVILALTSLAFFFVQSVRNTKSKKLPPGPRGFPIIGCLHLFRNFSHTYVHQLAQKYGPIMHMRLGSVPTIVVSSPQAAELFLKTHDLVFASRPIHESEKYLCYGQKNMVFAPYGSYWRNMRKMCTLELLSNYRINSFKDLRKEEVDLVIQSIKVASRERVAVDLTVKISALSANNTCRLVFGKKYTDEEYDERGFKAVSHESSLLAGAFNYGDYIPQIAALDLQGLTKRMKTVGKLFDDLFEKIIDEHIQRKDENRNKDFVDVMLGIMGSEESEYRIDRDNIKAIMMDMLTASMDTSGSTVEWALSELLKNPRAMKIAQKELEEKVGLDRMVEESDLESLEYIDMVAKETLRLHPVVPLLLPHESVEDCTINGFFIPKKSTILISAWSIGRDPSVWPDPEKFMPERFAGKNIDIRGQNFQIIPFGAGRRGCPGIQLGLTFVRLAVAQFLHCFDWELPNGMSPDDLDMTEEFGLVMHRAKTLLAVPTYRLNI